MNREQVFGEYLREKRMERKFGINELALRANIAGSTISRVENGTRGIPKPPTIKKLADGLNIAEDELMKVAGYKVHIAMKSNENNFFINEVLTSGEAEEILSLAEGTINKYCKSGAFLPDEARKSSNVWLVTREGIMRVFKNEFEDIDINTRDSNLIHYGDLMLEDQSVVNAVKNYISKIEQLKYETNIPYRIERTNLESYVEDMAERANVTFLKKSTKGKTYYIFRMGDKEFKTSIHYRKQIYSRYEIEGVEF